MSTKIQDYKCKTCKHTFEFLAHGDEDQPEACPKCHDPLHLEPIIATPLVTKCHDPEVLKATLKERSAKHTARELKKIAGHKGTLPKRIGRKGYQIGDS